MLHPYVSDAEISIHKINDGRYLATSLARPVGLIECHDVPGSRMVRQQADPLRARCVWEPAVRNLPGLTLPQDGASRIERALKGRKRTRKHALEDLKRAYAIASVAFPRAESLTV
jgi:hypothetical protein